MMTELERQILDALRQLNEENTVKAFAYLEVLLNTPETPAADPPRVGAAS